MLDLIDYAATSVEFVEENDRAFLYRLRWPQTEYPRLRVFLDASEPCDYILRVDGDILAQETLHDPRVLDFDLGAREAVEILVDTGGASLRSLRLAPAPGADHALAQPFVALESLDDTALMRGFESLGDNCEFGIVQRRFMAEPLDLYRFSAVPLGWILYGIDRDYVGIDQSEPHEVTLEQRGDGQIYYYAYQREYRIQYETGIRHDLKDATSMKRESLRRMHYLAWRLLNSLRDGERIMTYRSARPLAEAELLAFSDRLARKGPAIGLVVQAQENPGAPEWVAPNLIRATLPRFADPTRVVDTVEPDLWRDLCRKVYAMAVQRRNGNTQAARAA